MVAGDVRQDVGGVGGDRRRQAGCRWCLWWQETSGRMSVVSVVAGDVRQDVGGVCGDRRRSERVRWSVEDARTAVETFWF